MQYIYNKTCLQHDTGDHPECIARLSRFADLPDTEIPDASGLLRLVHSEEHINKIKTASAAAQSLDADTVTSVGSYEAALATVGAAVLASEQQGFSLMRPPGHHAYRDAATGFCLFNSIAVAAQNLANQGKKVLIFDFDGHFGDGTSDIFYKSNQVLYWSLHQGPAFPYKGLPEEIGRQGGEGYNWNVNLPAGSGDDIFTDVLETFLPLAEQFQPDVVAVSAGFDGHHSDPLLQLNFSVNSYYRVGQILREKFSDLFVVLEGGYNLAYLPHCIEAFTAGVNGEALPFTEEERTSEARVWQSYREDKQKVLNLLAKYR